MTVVKNCYILYKDRERERTMANDKWDKRFMEVARLVATWSSCFQENRQVGAVIARNKRILTTGYNGASSGVKNCKERGVCLRRELGIPSGTRQEICYATHAEQNAIIQAARMGLSVEGNAVLHPPAVRYLRQNDHQQRHRAHCVQRGIPRRVFVAAAERGARADRKIQCVTHCRAYSCDFKRNTLRKRGRYIC